MKMNSFKAIIFDLDGLLIDTEPVARECFLEASYAHGVEVPEHVYMRCIGTAAQNTKEIFYDEYGENFPYEEIFSSWRAYYNDHIENEKIYLKKGVKDLLNSCVENNIAKALGTSSQAFEVEVKLKNTKLDVYFPIRACGSDVKSGKPSPDIFELAAQRLGVSAKDCLVLEDSPNGVKAAMAAKMQVIQVPDLLNPSEEIVRLGHPIMDDLTQVKEYLKKNDHLY